jgi:hypothetical protein
MKRPYLGFRWRRQHKPEKKEKKISLNKTPKTLKLDAYLY